MILVLMGPTASGKSETAIEVALQIDGEIINADAFQVYRDFPIATMCPDEMMIKKVPHHLFRFISSSDPYDLHRYQKDARQKIEEVLNRNKTPILVGGSGLYIRSAVYDYDLTFDTSKVNMAPYSAMDDLSLHQKLEELDPSEAKKIPFQNRRRVLRSLEICLALGESKTSFLSKQKHAPIYPTAFYRLSPSREELYGRIEQRTEKMFDDGLEREVVPQIEGVDTIKGVYSAIGIKEFFPYRDGLISLDEVKQAIVMDTRHYVKRQETFFRHQFQTKEVRSAKEIIDDFSHR